MCVCRRPQGLTLGRFDELLESAEAIGRLCGVSEYARTMSGLFWGLLFIYATFIARQFVVLSFVFINSFANSLIPSVHPPPTHTSRGRERCYRSKNYIPPPVVKYRNQQPSASHPSIHPSPQARVRDKPLRSGLPKAMLLCFCCPPCPRDTEDDADDGGGEVARVLEEMATVTAPPARADSSGGRVLYLFSPTSWGLCERTERLD